MSFIEYIEITVDESDARYCKSFPVQEASSEVVQQFFEEYGFVIFRQVITDGECHQTIEEMWDLMEELTSSIKRDNPDTWNQGFSSFGMPQNTPSHSIFQSNIMRLRQHAFVVKCFAGILKNNDILCSHDRWLMHRPTKLGKPAFRSDWAAKPSVHLDLNPAEFVDTKYRKEIEQRLDSLRYGSRKKWAFISENNDVHKGFGRTVQGILNLGDLPNSENGGGTILIPGSPRWFEKWAKTVPRSLVGTTSHRFGPEMTSVAQRVTMRPGSLVIWDQRLIHGSTVNMSSNMRYGIPIRFFHAKQLSANRARDRSVTLRRIVQQHGFEQELTALGSKVFFGDTS
jgi:hypothetical protein